MMSSMDNVGTMLAIINTFCPEDDATMYVQDFSTRFC